MINKANYVELGLACAEVCRALDRGTNGGQIDQPSQSVLTAIEQLTTWVEPAMPKSFTHKALNRSTVTGIQTNIIKRGKRNVISRYFHKKADNKAIAAWRLDLNRILQVFNVRSLISILSLLTFRFQTELERNTCVDTRHDVADTHVTVSGIHHDPPNANNIVPDIRHDIPNTHAVVPDIRRDTLKNREDTNSNNPGVSEPCIMNVSE